jgi:4-amino-4-deoxy-L-arabinose transferase-like glycosyltransferase
VAALAALLSAALLLPGLGDVPFDDPGEGQHAEIAREAWVSGDWLTLRLSGIRYFDKPPLLYALMGAMFGLWGPSEWAARLPSVGGAMLAVAGTALLGARLMGPLWGFAAGAGLLSCTLFAVFGRYVRPETLFVACIQWGLAALLIGCAGDSGERGARRWAIAGVAALGLASLAKDPLGLLGPLAAVAVSLALAGRLRPWTAWLPAQGLALAMALGAGWYLLVEARSPGFLWYTVVDNHILNASRLRHFPDEDIPLSALEFLAVTGFGAFPWALGGVLGAAALLWRRSWRLPHERAWVALAIWALGVVALFTLSPFKLPHYGLPAYPALVLLAARWWRDRRDRARPAIVLHLAAFGILAAVTGLAAIGDGRIFLDLVLGVADVASRKAAVAGQPSALPPWEALRPLLAASAVIFAAAAIGLAMAARRRSGGAAVAIMACAMLAVVPLASRAMAAVSAARSVAGAAEVVRRQDAAAVLVLEGPIEQAGAIEFYSGRRPVFVDGRRSVLGFGATFAEAAEAFWDRDRFVREWLSPRPLLLLTARPPAASVVGALAPDRLRLLIAHNGRRLYVNAAADAAPPSLVAPAGPGVR